jgi:molybdopterin adenylyltransferase
MSQDPSPPSPTPAQHRGAAPASIACGVLTVSDTRTAENDKGGDLVAERLRGGGHSVAVREIVPDEPALIERVLRGWIAGSEVEAILITGGTGISPRDRTCDTVAALLTREIPGYGELLRMLSYQQIGAAAMLSRALGGLAGQIVVLTMPGSTAAVELAMEKLILPELGHLVYEAGK